MTILDDDRAADRFAYAPRSRRMTRLLDLLDRLAAKGEVGDDVHCLAAPPREREAAPAPSGRLWVRIALVAVSGLAGYAIIAASAPVWRNAPDAWRFTLPEVPHPPSSFAAGVLFLLGVILAGLGWIGLVGVTDRLAERRAAPVVLVIGLLWAVPVLLGPPLLSNDVYSYAAQGEMISRGIDPTADGPVMLGRGEFLYAVDPVWRTAPAPYGPVAILSSEGIVRLAGHDLGTAIWLFRGLATLGVVMAGVGTVLLARSLRVNRAAALALGIANPLVVIHLIGGAHNDALMLGFLALGLAAERRGHKVLTVTLLVCAAAVKLPAAVALVAVAWVWAGRDASLRTRLASLVRVGAASLALMAGLSVLAGVGFGAILALRHTGKVMDTFSLMTILGYFASEPLQALGLTSSPDALVGPFRLLGVLASGAATLWLIGRAPRWSVARSVGLAMVITVLLGPVVWPWYLPAGLALLAASSVAKLRPSYIVLVVSASALVWPTSVAAVEWLMRFQRVLSFFVIVGIGLACLVAQRIAEVRHTSRDRNVRSRPRSGLRRVPVGARDRRNPLPPSRPVVLVGGPSARRPVDSGPVPLASTDR